MMARRMRLVDVNNHPLTHIKRSPNHGDWLPIHVDNHPKLGAVVSLTGIYNQNTTATIDLVIEEQCEIGEWHIVSRQPLPFFGNYLEDTTTE
jgi:hypothetical protein